MIIKRIPAGTRIYLTKDKSNYFYLQPGKIYVNDNLYVVYDVKIDGKIVIPRGTRVTGRWITQSVPEPAAQLQLEKIYLSGAGQNISADSEVLTTVRNFKKRHNINNKPFLYKQKHWNSINSVNSTNIINHAVYKNSCNPTNIGTSYLEINSNEIPVILTEDLIPMPCFD